MENVGCFFVSVETFVESSFTRKCVMYTAFHSFSIVVSWFGCRGNVFKELQPSCLFWFCYPDFQQTFHNIFLSYNFWSRKLSSLCHFKINISYSISTCAIYPTHLKILDLIMQQNLIQVCKNPDRKLRQTVKFSVRKIIMGNRYEALCILNCGSILAWKFSFTLRLLYPHKNPRYLFSTDWAMPSVSYDTAGRNSSSLSNRKSTVHTIP
jgi:hypothetical protein